MRERDYAYKIYDMVSLTFPSMHNATHTSRDSLGKTRLALVFVYARAFFSLLFRSLASNITLDYGLSRTRRYDTNVSIATHRICKVECEMFPR